MVREYGRTAKRNLREGAKKMESAMTAAARVRREFQLGRPPKALGENEHPEPLHPAVLWKRATEALEDFRKRMTSAKLNPQHARAAVIYIESTAPELPRFLPLEEEGESSEERRKNVVEFLMSRSDDVIVLGMIFEQWDEEAHKKAIFPKLFFGLNAKGMAVLRHAAEVVFEAGEFGKNVN